MSAQEWLRRFEELEAGRILGDLDTSEVMEWQEFPKEPWRGSGLPVELAAAAIGTDFVEGQEIALPDDIAELVREGIPKFPSPKESAGSFISPPLLEWVSKLKGK